MKEEHFQSFHELFEFIYKGDTEAIEISMKLVNLANTWDDIIDGDKPNASAVNQAFLDSIFTFHTYHLWNACGLGHHVLNAFLKWRDATFIENDPNRTDDDLNKCYMLRAGLYDIFAVIAFCLHGSEWVAEVGPMIRRYYGETLEAFKEEMTCQIQL